MIDLRKWGAIGISRARGYGARAVTFARSRRARRIAIGAAIVVVLLGLATYVAVPMILHDVLVGTVARQLKRPVSVGRIRFNLYRLRLDIDQLHIGEVDGKESFVDLGHLHVRVSWTSLFRRAPVVKEVSLTQPSIHVVREAEQRFNFSDLLEAKAPAPPPKEKPSGKPMRFAVSNIRIIDGAIHFDDHVLGEQHRIEHIQLGVPFIANLPADVDIYVQPLLEMLIDGSPLRVVGLAKPFANPPESVVDVRLHRLDLQRYLAYAPKRIAIKIPSGTLSSDVQVRFVNATAVGAHPHISVNGAVALDQLAVHDGADAPLVELKHAVVKLTDVEPLENAIALGKIWIDGLVTHVTLNADGSNNFASVMGSTPAPSAAPTIAAPLMQAAQTPPAPEKQMNAMAVSLDAFQMANSSVKLIDNRNPTPNAVSLDDIHAGLQNFRLNGQTPAPFDFGAKLASGGTIALKGALDLTQSQATTDVTIDQIDLPGLQGFAQPTFVGTIASGKLDVHANVQAHFGPAPFNVHVEPANVSISDLKVDDPKHETPIQWKTFAVVLGQFDLASHQAVVNEVRADGINLFVRRGRRGELSLTSLVKSSAPAPKQGHRPKEAKRAPSKEAAPQSPAWKYSVASIALDNTVAHMIDESTPRHADVNVAPLSIHLKNVSEDLAKPIAVDIAGTLNHKGTFEVEGTAAPVPLKADLKIATARLSLAPFDPYAASKLNTTITSAALTMKGALGLDNSHKDFRVSYRGDVGLSDVMVLDKATGDPFIQWTKLNISRINVKSGGGPVYAHIGAVAMDYFYARVILRKDGSLNLKDVVAKEKAPPTSLTRNVQAAPETEETSTRPATPEPQMDLEVGKIAVEHGHLNYSDYFVQPNYSADLTEITGKIGKFGSATTEPANVALDGLVNGTSPIDISGAMNPLAPKASLDITAKADGIELTGLTPYSNTYAGYPITKGTLTLNVHYLLKDQNLTAENHILLDQLTFGEPLEGAKASKIPLRLAIALLKDRNGKIDLNIPVSGSLSDPKFSVTDVLLGALKNIIIKAATAPFNLIASAIPGFHGGGGEQAAYVEFAPGFATLTPDAHKALDTYASALEQRPSLRLSIAGRVDPTVDRDGLREAKLLDQMKTEKMKAKGGGDIDGIELTASEKDKYLARVYKQAKFDKPANFLGLDKSIPPDQMKKLIFAHTDVSDADLHRLADARAAAVRKYISTKVDPGRLFIAAPKLNAEGLGDKGKTTRADLSFE